MLFPSSVFLFGFLPVALLGTLALQRFGAATWIPGWLLAASLFFYAWWNPVYLVLLGGSIVLNFALGRWLLRGGAHRGAVLVLGVVANLGLLGYFKYAHLVADTWNQLAGGRIHLDPIVLPLAISFFTFQQIAYLVDTHRGTAGEKSFSRYALFISFFPQLIAGPIVHYREMVPQFATDRFAKLRVDDLAIGFTLLAFGLFKKVILADGVSEYADAVFLAVGDGGIEPTAAEAWLGTLAFTFQVYFDFSGYSDMALGLARLFGVRLPENFDSPYKATSVTEFWGRWHMTLSRFLRDYVYFPMYFARGRNAGAGRRAWCVLVTLLLGGLWHGATWTFVLWGGLIGAYIVIHDLWRGFRRRLGHDLQSTTRLGRILARSLTFLAVAVSMAVFRAGSFDVAWEMLSALLGGNGVPLPGRLAGRLGSLEPWLVGAGFDFSGAFRHGLVAWPLALPFLTVLAAIVFLAPNTLDLLALEGPSLYRKAKPSAGGLVWRPVLVWAVIVAAAVVLSVLNLNRVDEFVYFQF